MHLRKLVMSDAVPMLDWMHNENVVEHFDADFSKMTLQNCMEFIQKTNECEAENIHRAICNDNDQYLGTVSLKSISLKDKNAEYAIVINQESMGQGVAQFATKSILKIAFEELGLHKVYLYVKGKNIRARKFYEKIGFRVEGVFVDHKIDKNGAFDDLYWLAILDTEYQEMKTSWIG